MKLDEDRQYLHYGVNVPMFLVGVKALITLSPFYSELKKSLRQ